MWSEALHGNGSRFPSAVGGIFKSDRVVILDLMLLAIFVGFCYGFFAVDRAAKRLAEPTRGRVRSVALLTTLACAAVTLYTVASIVFQGGPDWMFFGSTFIAE